jgi:hypothetical protein
VHTESASSASGAVFVQTYYLVNHANYAVMALGQMESSPMVLRDVVMLLPTVAIFLRGSS